MSTSCSDILTRALALSVANQGLLDPNVTADVQTALSRISQAQIRAFIAFTQANRTAFLTTVTKASNAANGHRVVDLATQDPRVERIVRVELPSGTEVALVDPAVPTSEMAPRYFTEGDTLHEILNDWDTTTANAVTLTILCATRPPELDVSALGTLSQAVSIPDRFTDILVYELGAFLAESDVGRDDAEVTELRQKSAAVLSDWINSSAQFGGVATYTFTIPTPTPDSKA
jgi:hypothetical protein